MQHAGLHTKVRQASSPESRSVHESANTAPAAALRGIDRTQLLLHHGDVAPTSGECEMYDLLIKNAMICDGLGPKPQSGSVGVQNGRIAAVGPDVGPARRVVDADGLSLMPGIIDTHTHYDAQITWDPLATPSPGLGVTTVVMGNCGFTIAPCRPPDRDLVMRNLTHVEGMSLDTLRAAIQWSFETFPEYLDFLESSGVGPNVAAFVGHSSVRTFVMGEDASRRAATDDEIAKMRRIVDGALQAGAVGFSSTTSLQHNGENGIPMPSRLADEREMRTLVGTLGDAGRGIFMLTKGIHTEVSFLESLAAESRRPVLIAALLHSPLDPDSVFHDLAEITAARSRGRLLRGAVSCCPLNFEFTMRSPYPMEGLASWKPAMQAHGEQALKAIYADATFRSAVKREITESVRRLFTADWDTIRIAQVANPAHQSLEGKSIAELSKDTGKDPFDWMLDFSLSENLDTVFTATLLNQDEAAVARLLTDPNSLVSLSDAGAHLVFLCDAGFGLHLLGYWVRDKRLMPLTEAVRKLTSEPAMLFGIVDRGRIAPGAWADLVLFDPATVGRGPLRRLFDLPANGSRMVTPAMGLHGVWINGQQLADGGGIIGDAGRPGKVLRSFAS
jgi:N-acyl-D-aspartate/D-glutamate deacylase